MKLDSTSIKVNDSKNDEYYTFYVGDLYDVEDGRIHIYAFDKKDGVMLGDDNLDNFISSKGEYLCGGYYLPAEVADAAREHFFNLRNEKYGY